MIKNDDEYEPDIPYRVDFECGTIAWKLNGVLHREDGPAVLGINGRHRWYTHGLLHRIDGPAWISGADPNYMEWYLNGVEFELPDFIACIVSAYGVTMEDAVLLRLKYSS